MNSVIKITYCVFLLILTNTWISAQYYEVPLESRINNAEYIIEGEVLSKESFVTNGHVYTSNKVKVLNWIVPSSPLYQNRGLQGAECIEIITLGGFTTKLQEVWTHSIQYAEGQLGLFFLKTSDVQSDGGLISLKTYADVQGFMPYSKNSNFEFLSSDHFNEYVDIQAEVISQIVALRGISGSVDSHVEKETELNLVIENFAYNTTEESGSFDISILPSYNKKVALKELNFELKSLDEIFSSVEGLEDKISFTLDASLSNESYTSSSSHSNSEMSTKVKNEDSGSNMNFGNGLQRRLGSVSIDLTLDQIADIAKISSNFDKAEQFVLTSAGEVQNVFRTSTSLDINQELYSQVINITSVSPLTVAAGTRRNVTLTYDQERYPNIITIRGSGFGDIDEADFSSIPFTNRVEFEANGVNALVGDRVTPLPRDYIRWDSNIIILYVPTTGYAVSGGSVQGPLGGTNAASGKVTVVTGDISFESSDSITVDFAQLSTFDNNVPREEQRSYPYRHVLLDGNSTIPSEGDVGGIDFFL